MGLFTDSVPRDLHDALQQRYDDLLEKYHSLRLVGNAPVKPMTLHMPRTDTGTQAVRAAEIAFVTPRVRGVVENLMRDNPLLLEADALREAQRLERIITGKELPIAAGELHMPPAR